MFLFDFRRVRVSLGVLGSARVRDKVRIVLELGFGGGWLRSHLKSGSGSVIAPLAICHIRCRYPPHFAFVNGSYVEIW
jgi:hypothetical protein